MESMNGVLSPPPPINAAGVSPQLSAKRKRAESIDPLQEINGTGDSSGTNQPQPIFQDSQQNIGDLVEVLKSHDISPSILNRQLPLRESSDEPQPKRKKSASAADLSTIIGRAASGSYTKLEDILSDVRVACSATLEELDLPSGATRTQYTPIAPKTSELAARVKAFKSIAANILEGERAHNVRKLAVQAEEGVDIEAPLVNGNVAVKTVTQLSTSPGDIKAVLTLFGNAPGPKQLFSSLQQPVKAEDGTTEVVQSLREAGLPNGISTTQVVPLQASGLVEEKKKVPTMGELFAHSTSTLPFQPPKPSQVASTRSSIVNWYKPTELESLRSRNNQSYFGQAITSGEWLDYAGSSSIPDPKRKQRERALSLGGGKMPSISENSVDKEASKMDALFRSVYSGFAPAKDDAAAIVPEGIASRIWWQRIGEKSFERLVKNAAHMEMSLTGDAGVKVESSIEEGAGTNDLDEFESIVEEWDERAIDPNLELGQDFPKSIDDKDVEEILQDISELLETLNSYQRIRNVSINPLHRSGGPIVASDPARPSESEIATYNILKSQLTLMVAMLPPYAVAKLNSDQLADLNISTKIVLFTENHKGVMEEDEAAARAKVAEMRAATSSRPNPTSALHRGSSLYGNQYSASVRTPTPSGQQQYYPQAQTPVRQPSAGMARPPATTPNPYPGQRQPSATSHRQQSNYATPTYAHQLPRTSQSQFGQSSGQQYFQPPQSGSYGQAGSQSFSSTPISNSQSGLNTRYQAQTQSAYQSNRAQTNGADYRYSNGGNAARQTSPQKPQVYNPQPQTAQPQSRPYGLPATSTPQDLRYFQPSTSNGSSALSPQPQLSQSQNGTLGVTGYHTVMTAEQQSNMMERQRAQLAQQQGTQQHARSVAQAGAMSTSPAPQVNGGNAVTAGL